MYKKLNEQQKKIIDSFKGATLASLTKSMMEMSVEGEENLLKFKTMFFFFIQKCFLLPTTISIVSPIHKSHVLHVEIVREWNWMSHVFNFLLKGIKAQKAREKLSVDGCIFVLMIIYFHKSMFTDGAADDTPEPWVAYWTRRRLVDRIAFEAKNEMVIKKYHFP
ncbi:hypothetical protein AHAS_Ahas07G0148800 [Arachis hypogaea]